MEQNINRVNDAVHKWNQSEKEHTLLYPEIMNSPSFAKARLREINTIRARFSNSKNQDEQRSLKFLNLEAERLAKTVNGKLWNLQKWLPYHLTKLIVVSNVVAKINKSEKQNDEAFVQSIIKAGFGEFVNQIKDLIKQGKKAFTYSTPYQNNENEVTNFNLKIGYDEAGGHNFNNYHASYINKFKPGEIRQQEVYTNNSDGLTPEQVADLMAGRPLYDQYHGWRQLDLTDKDEKGSYRMMNIKANDFDLEKRCEEHPIWDKLSPSVQAASMLKMQFGKQAAVKFEHLGIKHKVFLQASATSQQVLTFDEKGKLVDLNKMLAPASLKVPQPEMTVVKSPKLTATETANMSANKTKNQQKSRHKRMHKSAHKV